MSTTITMFRTSVKIFKKGNTLVWYSLYRDTYPMTSEYLYPYIGIFTNFFRVDTYADRLYRSPLDKYKMIVREWKLEHPITPTI